MKPETEMLLSSKCPNCKKVIAKIKRERGIQIEEDTFVEYAVTYACPECDTVLGIEADPEGRSQLLAERLRQAD
jgi:uncharacterized protein with PIN domain